MRAPYNCRRFRGTWDDLDRFPRRCVITDAAGGVVVQCDDGSDAARALDKFAARCRSELPRKWFEGLIVWVEK